MKTQTNFMGMSLTDIIFDNRNKAYGAYELRQSYNSSILKAMVTTTLFAVLLIIVPKIYAKLFPQVADTIAEVKIVLADIPKVIVDYIKPPQIEPPRSNSNNDKSTALFGTMAATSDNKPTVDSIATVDDLQLTDVGDKFNKGSGEKDGTSSNESTKGNIDAKAKEISQIYTGATVEVLPEFPGGEAALMRFIANNVSYPDRERELGIEGKVVVGFIIDETGKVTEVTAIKKLSAGLDNESVRVVNLLPRFKPGMQGGRPVKVRYVLPMKYQYQ